MVWKEESQVSPSKEVTSELKVENDVCGGAGAGRAADGLVVAGGEAAGLRTTSRLGA